MKITKIPGLGRFGVFIDDLDFNNLSDEEWMQIGKIHLESLVTIIRNVNCDIHEYERRIHQWGNTVSLTYYTILKKYKTDSLIEIYNNTTVNGVTVADSDKLWIEGLFRMLATEEAGGMTNVFRVSGKKNADGKNIGIFSEGELLWHSNESGRLNFAPGVSLLGVEGVIGSATGFVTTPDWYEKQSESFRTELDEMIILHKFSTGKISPGIPEEEDHFAYREFCPVDSEIPLVIKSPGGITGMHYSVNTVSGIKGMSQNDADKLFKHINTTLFTEEYIYDHWYQQNNDLCLFDNSITLHRRLGGITNRTCHRMQYDYGHIATNNVPYLQEPYASQYIKERDLIHQILKLYSYK